MNEDDDIFEDEIKESDTQEPAKSPKGIEAGPPPATTSSDVGGGGEILEKTHEPEEQNSGESAEQLSDEDENIDIEEDPAQSPGGIEAGPPPATTSSDVGGGGEKPFTIAQLAQANTARKSMPSKKSKAKTPTINIYKKEKLEENGGNMPEGQLAIDVYETPSEIVIKSTIAGAGPGDLDVGIEDNTVNIRGSRHNEEKVRGEDYLYQECYWGAFSRSIILPTEIDSEKAHASLKDGVLTIRVPKLKKERERKIKIVS